MLKVCKFGGTSMASAQSILNIKDIVSGDPSRRYVVVSAPGKRFSDDVKVTDLLYKCYKEKTESGSCHETFSKIRERFNSIVSDLGLSLDIGKYLDEAEEGINNARTPDYSASRGEYLGAIVTAACLGADFVDASEIIKFRSDGSFDSEYTNDLAGKILRKHGFAVVPGFYGSLPDGEIKTFSRGGSDITGAIVARAVSAKLYENWTDVSGFMMADPRIVDNPGTIKELSYKELRELSYMGANVLHPESIFPVRQSNIPINIKNTFRPEDPGTKIVPYVNLDQTDKGLITGIAGRKDFTIILIEKSMMNSTLGFVRRVLTVLENYGISFEHMPSGIDTLSLIICESSLKGGKLDVILKKISEAVEPDYITAFPSIAMIATVGHGMAYRPGTAARIFKALAAEDVNIRMIDQGSSEMNIIVGVDNVDYEKAIRAIHEEFKEDNK